MTAILLDTNAYTGLINGNASIYEQITQADVVYMSTVVLGELYAGFQGGSKLDWNSNILRDFLEMKTVETVDVTHGTAKIFGVIKNELKQKARMIPVNDIWIAAHAIETDSTLLTDDKHFENVSNLKTNRW